MTGLWFMCEYEKVFLFVAVGTTIAGWRAG